MNLDAVPEEMRELPVHGITGEPMAECVTISNHQDILTHHMGPPRMPTREIWDVNDDTDELVFIRDRTDAELIAATADYNKAMREWGKTGGIIRTAGRVSVTGHFRTASGAEVEGEWDGGRWMWFRESTEALE